MQPTQSSLWPETLPAPPDQVINDLPEHHVAAALKLLSELIAKAADPRTGQTAVPDRGRR